MAEPFVLFFDECRLKDLSLMGGKGANLGELTSAGFRVPSGFGVTSSAYQDFLEYNRLREPIRQIAEAINFADFSSVEEGTARIRERMAAAPLPDPVATAIRKAYLRLGVDRLVAVRSSSAVPKLEISSFPGQMDTFYDIRGIDAVIRHIRLCWSSVWTTRAAANRWNKGIDHHQVMVCALVQLMVDSEFSGVSFTVNPVTMSNELVIEAIPGLGADLVSGQVTPERYVVDKQDLRIIENTGGTAIPVEVIREAARMSLRIESHYGQPQDIEWAWSESDIFALQTRKIVRKDSGCFYPGLERWNKPACQDEADIIWTRAWSDEVLTRAITPLFYSVQADLITVTYDFIYRCYGLSALLPLRIMRFHKNRGYFSTRYLKECLRYAPQFARTNDALKFFAPSQMEEVREMPFLLWSKLLSEIHLALFHRKYTFTQCHKTYEKHWLPELRRRVEEINSLHLASATLPQLRKYFDDMDRLMKRHCEPIGIGVMVHTFASVSVLETLVGKWTGSKEASALLGGLPGNMTVELNQELWNLAARIRRQPELARLFLEKSVEEIESVLKESRAGLSLLAELDTVRETYDFRGAEDRELSFPRWGDDPILLLNVVKLLASAGDDSSPEAVLQRNSRRREELTREIGEQLRKQPWGFVKKRLFEFLLKYAQIYSLFRENQRFDVDRVFYGQRKAFVAISHRLVHMNLLKNQEDVWFLSKEEVFDLMEGRLTTEEAYRRIVPRQGEYRQYLHNSPLMFLQGDREWDIAEKLAEVQDAKQLSGVPASVGQASGVARVVRSIGELSRVRAGDILVANSTDPGWTPVFLLIRGLVLETGGILAHGTVLSREYGIPAVTSVKNATSIIRDGDPISIDGAQGIVVLPQ